MLSLGILSLPGVLSKTKYLNCQTTAGIGTVLAASRWRMGQRSVDRPKANRCIGTLATKWTISCQMRSDDRQGGKEVVSTCRSRWPRYAQQPKRTDILS